MGSGHWMKYTNPVTLTFDHNIVRVIKSNSIAAFIATMSRGNQFIGHMTNVPNLLFTNQLFFMALSCIILNYVEVKVTSHYCCKIVTYGSKVLR